MPTYTWKNRTTGEVTDRYLHMSEYDDFERDNPHLERVLFPVAIVDPIRLGVTKPDQCFRERLKEIKSIHSRGFTRSTVNDR